MSQYFEIKDNGIMLQIKLSPKAKKVGFLGVMEGVCKIGVSSPPVDNAANEELIKFLSKEFRVARQAISIEAGNTSRNKRVFIQGVSKVPEKWAQE